MREKRFYKSKILPTILMTILLMFLISFISALSLCNILINTFYMDCSRTNQTTEKIAKIIELEMMGKNDTIYFYTEFLQSDTTVSIPSLLNRINRLADQKEFPALAIISDNHDSITNAPDILSTLSLSDIHAQISSADTDTDYIINTKQQIIYSAPLTLEGFKNAYLIGLIPTDIDSFNLGDEFSTDNAVLYLLNEQDEVISYLGNQTLFDYDALDKTLLYVPNSDISLPEHSFQIHSLLTQEGLKNFEQLLNGNKYVWYEKPVLEKSGNPFKVLIARRADFSNESIMITLNISILVAFIILTFSALMIFSIISRGISNKKLSKLAYDDPITGLCNWNRFSLDVTKCLLKNKKFTYAMVSLDIRKFRVVSDIDGNQKSEFILKSVGKILHETLNKKEYSSRFSIDEFALLLKYQTEKELLERIQQLNVRLKSAYGLKELDYYYGVYFITEPSIPFHRIYNYSCISKDMHKHMPNTDMPIGIFSEGLRNNMLREKELEGHMEEALQQEEFQVYLQPKYRSDGSMIAGAEALVRWSSPKLGFISPGDFIPLFESNGFIMKLDNYMLEHVCAFQEKWMQQGKELITISVNISRMHMLDSHLVQDIISIVDKYKVPYSCIELELTESAFFEDKHVLLSAVNALRQHGFLVSMDDFGSGYSSLNSLKDLPLDVIKLDGEFFRESDNKERCETVIKDTIALAKHLNMKIVAEGIETQAQVTFLNEVGCDLIQGYYFARPMPLADFESLMGY